ncbi:hypothetical protein BJF93_23700 [Xaviernesmea oryzae]|uniref:GCVT N-terminal domain-containing protein n=1 Tax=Xaviernesmea oryzae TaxID=464029 RepID=A0A1Q9B2Z5_9HYPH|nr:sarcosine oxidase subunit gamma family protein [Xaviernesmea oryzae]OLP62363.1 hypothetical protein BJF93_23700 [Xaviernesmea oryzae]SEL98224.1 sarcosine oxidase subunit gamma [Xaviernesmea oryzae]
MNAPLTAEADWHHPLAGMASSPVRAVDHLDICRRQAVGRVLAAPGEGAAVAAILAQIEGVRTAGVEEWLVVDAGTDGSLALDLAERLGDLAFVLDASDADICLRLSGPNSRRILAKGIGIDLHPDVFGIGAAGYTLCHGIRLHLARMADTSFEILVPRSYAQSLMDALKRMGREFDLSTGFSA